MNPLPTPPSTLWKIVSASGVFTGIAIWQHWYTRILVIGGFLTVLRVGLYVYWICSEKNLERLEKKAEKLIELEHRKATGKRKEAGVRY